MAKASGHSLSLLSFSIPCYTQRFDEDTIQLKFPLHLLHYFSSNFLLIKSIPPPFHPVFLLSCYLISAMSKTFLKSHLPTERNKLICLELSLADSKSSDYPWLSWGGLFSKPQ